MAALSTASRNVNQATAQVVASITSGRTTLNEKGWACKVDMDPGRVRLMKCGHEHEPEGER